MKKTTKQKIRDLDNLIRIQLSDGNWDYNPYMHGLLNGLIISQQIFDPACNRECVSAPNRWLYKKTIGQKIAKFIGKLMRKIECPKVYISVPSHPGLSAEIKKIDN